MTGARGSLKVWLVVGGITVVVVALLFAPIITVISYGDAPEGSVTFTEQRSIVGFGTSLWLWLSVTVGSVVVVALAALSASRLGRTTSTKVDQPAS